jgi:hypothetical protein
MSRQQQVLRSQVAYRVGVDELFVAFPAGVLRQEAGPASAQAVVSPEQVSKLEQACSERERPVVSQPQA